MADIQKLEKIVEEFNSLFVTSEERGSIEIHHQDVYSLDNSWELKAGVFKENKKTFAYAKKMIGKVDVTLFD